MATNSLQSLNCRHHKPPLRRRRHSLDSPQPTVPLNNTKPNPNHNHTISLLSISSTTKTHSLSSTTSSSSTSQSTSFDLLQRLLAANDFRQADEETRRLIIALAGEAAVKRGYVFFSEVQFIPEADLKTIDQLWREYSNNKFGYSVQKRLWDKTDKDFTKFFIKVGWMKKLETEVVQYNYRAFPDEFMWELTDETPEGHLPLTNALRGTQLLTCILSHPAFVAQQETPVVEQKPPGKEKENKKTVGKGLFKTNYTF